MPRATVKPSPDVIVRLRSMKDLTQEELGNRAGYAKRTIERIEAGSPTRISTLEAISEVLDVHVSTLLAARERPATSADKAILEIQLNDEFYKSPEEAQQEIMKRILSLVKEAKVINVRYGSIVVAVEVPRRSVSSLTNALAQRFPTSETPAPLFADVLGWSLLTPISNAEEQADQTVDELVAALATNQPHRLKHLFERVSPAIIGLCDQLGLAAEDTWRIAAEILVAIIAHKQEGRPKDLIVTVMSIYLSGTERSSRQRAADDGTGPPDRRSTLDALLAGRRVDHLAQRLTQDIKGNTQN